MSVWLVMLPVLAGAPALARILDLDIAVSEMLGDWWRRMASRGRHTVREVRRRQVREEAAYVATLDRVWVTGIAEWAERARGQGLDRGMIAARAS